MKQGKIIKIVISSLVGIIIDQTFSITEIIRKALEPIDGPFLTLVKPLIILCFFLIEIAGVYQFLDKLKIFDKVFK